MYLYYFLTHLLNSKFCVKAVKSLPHALKLFAGYD
ncbi:hypothetical protein KSF78_0001103 [Schistosoma japonicum]|nr:hypothetical protein KSF78_0001103 [Schistosoma japonicum]